MSPHHQLGWTKTTMTTKTWRGRQRWSRRTVLWMQQYICLIGTFNVFAHLSRSFNTTEIFVLRLQTSLGCKKEDVLTPHSVTLGVSTINVHQQHLHKWITIMQQCNFIVVFRWIYWDNRTTFGITASLFCCSMKQSVMLTQRQAFGGVSYELWFIYSPQIGPLVRSSRVVSSIKQNGALNYIDWCFSISLSIGQATAWSLSLVWFSLIRPIVMTIVDNWKHCLWNCSVAGKWRKVLLWPPEAA